MGKGMLDRIVARFLIANLMVPPELEHSISIVSGFLSGARKAKFQAGVQVLRDSIASGQWIPRGGVKVNSSLYQGLVSKLPPRSTYDESPVGTPQWSDFNSLESCLKFGSVYDGDQTIDPQLLKVPEPVQRAWFHCCRGMRNLSKLLDQQRPKPVLTEVGLSPKVTKTLMEMELDIDLKTIKVPPVEKIGETQSKDRQGNPMFLHGKPVMEPIYKVMWEPGTKFGMSRFSDLPEHCEACGKRIPSNMYVPIEAQCRKHGYVGLLIGTDCARNIFGVKDKGFNRANFK
jgi:hypothetical protein